MARRALTVHLTHPFWMMSTEATQADWLAVAEAAGSDVEVANPAYHEGRSHTCRGESATLCPVERVSWLDAVWHAIARDTRDGLDPCYPAAALDGCDGSPHDGCPDNGPYCHALNSETMFDCSVDTLTLWTTIDLVCAGSRLPTEAEWEYAHRAGTTTRYWHGQSAREALDETAWHGGNSAGSPQRVGVEKRVMNGQPAFPATPERPPDHPWGLHDTHGNVAEWVHDRWQDRLSPDPVIDPAGLAGAVLTERTIRGGGWSCTPDECRSASRTYGLIYGRDQSVGFRLVRPMVPMVDDPTRCPAE